MLIKHLEVHNFRGIKYLDWAIDERMVGLIGTGDSCKTSILHAIEFALNPKWNLQFSDNDFYENNTNEPIEIFVTCINYPESFNDEKKFGLHLRGWNSEHGIQDEPGVNREDAITIKFSVNNSLEPSWHIFTDRDGESLNISSNDRDLLGVSLISSYFDHDLTWGRYSALTRFTGKDNIENASKMIPLALRNAREGLLDHADLRDLIEAADQAAEEVKPFGVKPKNKFNPGIDPAFFSFNSNTLALHDGEIPVRTYGLGSRKLVSMAIQITRNKKNNTLLLDEVEIGLEPYRLRNLLRLLRPIEGENRQVFLTTHSNICAVEMKASELFLVRTDSGNVSIKKIGDELQGVVRNCPEALFSRKIIACEGSTEFGFCIGIDTYYQHLYGAPLSYNGVAPTVGSDSGGNTKMPPIAVKFKELGFDVCYFGDTDIPIKPEPDKLIDKGIDLFLWDGNYAIEQRIFSDLPKIGIQRLLDYVAEIETEVEIIHEISSYNANMPKSITEIVETFEQNEIFYRQTLGAVAKRCSWYKSVTKGIFLGEITSQYMNDIKDSNLFKVISELGRWCYA